MAVLRVAVGVLILGACSSGAGEGISTTLPPPASPATTAADPAPPDPELCADVVAVDFTASSDGSWDVSVTVSSPDVGDEKYADEWRIVAPDDTVLGLRVLTHPHVDEQPFTRSLTGVEIPDEVDAVTVEARDSVEGYCGSAMTVAVP